MEICGDMGGGSVSGDAGKVSPVLDLEVIAHVFGIFIHTVFKSQDILLIICKFSIICAEEKERWG